jgi:hypothetical protein
MRVRLHAADDELSALRIRTGEVEHAISDARHAHDAVRTTVVELDIARDTSPIWPKRACPRFRRRSTR